MKLEDVGGSEPVKATYPANPPIDQSNNKPYEGGSKVNVHYNTSGCMRCKFMSSNRGGHWDPNCRLAGKTFEDPARRDFRIVPSWCPLPMTFDLEKGTLKEVPK